MRKINISILSAILLFAVLLTSCNMPAKTNLTPTPDAKFLITEAALTVAAQLTENARLTPSPQPSPSLGSTNTVQPPQPPTTEPTQPPAPSETPKPNNATAPDNASFVADVTVPDGTGAAPGAVFEKTWRIKNSGTTTWSSAYALVWVDGEKMGSPESIAIPKDVRPGETVDISVTLTAPAKAGTYQTFFRLRNASGQYFRLDGTGDLWVKINVGTGPTQTPDTTTTPIVTNTP